MMSLLFNARTTVLPAQPYCPHNRVARTTVRAYYKYPFKELPHGRAAWCIQRPLVIDFKGLIFL